MTQKEAAVSARPSWDDYFISMAKLVASRSTCNRLSVGAVIVKDKRVIATGYNGSLHGQPHCIDEGCLEINGSCVRAVHAERNALAQCAKIGIATDGATIYITHFPCVDCTKQIIQSGIRRIVYEQDYRNNAFAEELCRAAGVEVVQYQQTQ